MGTRYWGAMEGLEISALATRCLTLATGSIAYQRPIYPASACPDDRLGFEA